MDDELTARIEELLETPCWIIDILPERVSEDKAKEYAELEKVFLYTESLKRKFYNVLMKFRCYFDFKVVMPECDITAMKLWALVGHKYLQIMVGDALLILDPDDMYMSLYNPSDDMLELVKMIAATEGMCVWRS